MPRSPKKTEVAPASLTAKQLKAMGDFSTKFIRKFRQPEKSKGVHAVYSGFNDAFRRFFGADPVACVKTLVAEGVVASQPRRGGPMLYIAGEQPERTSNEESRIHKADSLLAKMGLSASTEEDGQESAVAV